MHAPTHLHMRLCMHSFNMGKALHLCTCTYTYTCPYTCPYILYGQGPAPMHMHLYLYMPIRMPLYPTWARSCTSLTVGVLSGLTIACDPLVVAHYLYSVDLGQVKGGW